VTTQGREAAGSWESLAPWDKAAEWQKAAPEIAEKVMELATQHARHRWSLEKRLAEHVERMDKRIWMTQVFGLCGGFLSTVMLAIVSWHYADTGNVFPGLVTAGAGAGLTAGVYAVGRALGKRRIDVNAANAITQIPHDS